MVNNEAHPFTVIFYEGEGAQEVDASTKFDIFSTLLDRGYAMTCAGGGGAMRASEDRSLLVLGDFGGNAPQIEDAAGKVELETRDISGLAGPGVLEMVEAVRSERPMNQPGAWKPWFPVIDYDRCTNCMQCLSFCLFDVYGVSDDGKIQVQNNDNCKTNCPACSRVCPEVAIMFPKYQSGPINGEPVKQADLEREKMKVDISSLLGGDIYASLRNRSEAAKSRFSKERSPDKALSERKKCLVKLQDQGLIPAEVLENLPSPEEIQQKAEIAAAKAKAALEMNAESSSNP